MSWKKVAPRLVLLLVLLSGFDTNCIGQSVAERMNTSLRFQQFNEEDGIIKVINCIYQDKQGFIWIGSETNGLYRYNGYEFRNYLYEFKDSNSISGTSIDKFLHEDSSGNIWISVSGTLNRYNRDLDNFIRFIP